MKLDMMGIITENFDTMLTFYKEVMEMETTIEMDNHAEFKTEGVRFALSTKQVMRHITEHEDYERPRSGQPFELAFLVDSPEEVDRKYEEIVTKGATPIKSAKDMPWGQRAAFFADPDGNIHELFAQL